MIDYIFFAVFLAMFGGIAAMGWFTIKRMFLAVREGVAIQQANLHAVTTLSIDKNEIAKTVANKVSESGGAAAAHVKAVLDAINSLGKRDEVDADADKIDEALAELKKGNTKKAEDLFRHTASKQRKKGRLAYQTAARAMRHLGALAYSHDTQKALAAYRGATELDSDNPDGWNMLGHLYHRLGELDQALAAHEKVRNLSNQPENKEALALALGNMGLIALTQGDLNKAEEYMRRSLGIAREIGKRESQSSTLGSYRR